MNKLNYKGKVFLDSGSAKGAARKTVFLPAGNFSALYIQLVGTTDAGETLTLADIGTIEYNRGGRSLQLQPWDFYNPLTDIWFGAPYSPTGGAAAAEQVSAIIPLYGAGFDNVEQIRESKEAFVNLSFDAVLDTRFGANAATWQLWALKAPDTFQSYSMKVLSQNFQASGAGRISNRLSTKNLVAVLVNDEADDILTTAQLIVDGRTIEDNTPESVALGITNIEAQVETTQNWMQFNVANGVRELAMNETADLSLEVDGAGTVRVVLIQADWLPKNVANQNLAEVQARLNSPGRGR